MQSEPEVRVETDVAYVLCDPIHKNKAVTFSNVLTGKEETYPVVTEEDCGWKSWDDAIEAARDKGYRYVRRDVYLCERDEEDDLIDLDGPIFSTWRQARLESV